MEQTFKLWDTSDMEISFFPTPLKSSDCAVIIFPGGGYGIHANHEGEGYAQLLNVFGVDAFVLKYRVSPNRFPLPLLDARRAVRYVRANAEKFGVSKDKILVMGSSAGGHLAALTCTYLAPIDGEGVDEIDSLDFVPNGQILCYPVISSDESISHSGSYYNLLGVEGHCDRDNYSPDLLVSDRTPVAFIWHTSTDAAVNVINSYRYAEALRNHNIPHELHVFPYGKHGLGVGASEPYVSTWTSSLKGWLRLNRFIEQ